MDPETVETVETIRVFVAGMICGGFFGGIAGYFLFALANISASADKRLGLK